MPSNTSTVGALLKEQIEPGLVNQLNTETPLLDSFSKGGETPILGKYKVKGVKVNRNRGGYYTAESGAIPVAGTVEIQNLMIPERFYHHAVSFTEQVLNASRSNEAAFADVMAINMDDVKETVRQRRNRGLWGDGRGIQCLVNGAATTTTVTVDAPGGIAGADDGTRFLNVGDWVAAVNPAGGLRQAVAYRVETVPTASTFTTNAAVTWSDNDYVVRCVETTGTLTIGNSEYNHLPMGLSGMADNSTLLNLYFGLSRTTFPILNAHVGTSIGALSADVIQRYLDVAHKVGGAVTNELWMESAVKRAYLKLMEADRRYMAADLRTPNAGTAAAGARKYADTGLKFGSIPIYQDPDCPYGHLFGLDTRSLKHYQGPMGWADRDGTVLRASTTAIDTWDAFFRCFEQFACEQPNQLFKMSGITCDVVAAHVL
jgi:hypothetical protein